MSRSLVSKSWRPPTPEQDTPDLIMSLPRELRDDIYERVLVFESAIEAECISKGNAISMLRVSKQIRSEASLMYYCKNTFIVDIKRCGWHQFAQLAAWLGSIKQLCGVTPLGCIKYRLWPCHWLLLLEAMQPLVETVHETGLQLQKSSNEHYQAPYTNGLRAVEEGLALGLHARSLKWSRERLVEEYDRFLQQWMIRGFQSKSRYSSVEESYDIVYQHKRKRAYRSF
ncbi:hypothetical protein LTR37_010045 [Vermiconidia calcicola]|uniref:Uncharacterized protein n=1 Tax=Vermiconidia calcicola TaxID=1690605 RepID=A0ACC3N8W3_9PEZI|nr:hypothetical protein LTR37_010045 [Vermiconidia calcicola]